MEKREILGALKKLGLGEYESKAYVALAFLGPSKAIEISREAGIPQSKIYETLNSLMEKQLVEVFEGRPKEFKAVSPEVAISSLMEAREDEFKELRKLVSTMISTLKPISRGDEVIEGVWTQKGVRAREVLNRLAEMLNRCERYAYDITKDFSYSSAFREAIKNCVRKNVKLFTISMSSINETNYSRAKWYHALGLPLRVFETKVHPRILVVDGREVSIRLDSNPFRRRFRFQSIWTQEPSLVKVFDTYMKNLWKIAKPIDFKCFRL